MKLVPKGYALDLSHRGRFWTARLSEARNLKWLFREPKWGTGAGPTADDAIRDAVKSLR